MAAKDVTLYYFPSSYFSLKALLALYEKNIPFKKRIVNMFASEQNENWYLKMNRNGEVPVLELDGEYIAESEVIIDVIDHTFTSGSILVPDLETKRGQEVREFRMLLDNIPIGIVTFGVLANRQFCIEDITSPLFGFDRKRTEQYMQGSYNKLLQKKKSCPPELIPVIERKIELNRKRYESILSESEVAKALDELEQDFDKLAARLEQSKRDAEDAQEYWLIGTSFTAADITATILMFRLRLIGVAPRYLSSEKRPIVHEYYNRIMKRPSIQEIVDINNSTSSYVYKQTVKFYGKKALKIGLVLGLVAIGYAGYREYSKIHRGLAKA
ncbi:ganglioside-induced differentiation-associated protein 1-like isoform X1 [Mercenaria mercenaria]|uniref:ganglioside-induced differentiation-associated protein 1-like isoform X1 n=1 Tax=Mercenaria mercenaria TaxID=6596 RepID=UPI00234EE97B|nr:ganglioside-induced differentiation-associated protein 1-like isoform X1 [Mercenaria mercenaria]